MRFCQGKCNYDSVRKICTGCQEICPECGKIISDDEYIVNWGTCGDCLSAHYDKYCEEHPNLTLDFDSAF